MLVFLVARMSEYDSKIPKRVFQLAQSYIIRDD